MFLEQLAARINPLGAEDALLRLLKEGGQKREILNAFKVLEDAAPVGDDLLLSDAASLADGRWTLLGTIASKVDDEEELVESGAANVVNASGIAVAADTARKPVQQIDVARNRIGNELYRPLPFGQNAIIRVAASFTPRPEQASGRRAYVDFDSLDIFLEKEEGAIRVLSLGFIFELLRRIRPLRNNGDTDGPWLETTYLNERLRLGRGNRGSIFVLERRDDAGGPLAAFPL